MNSTFSFRMIRKVVLFLSFVILSIPVVAQGTKNSAFISPVIKYQSILNHSSFCSGARFGWVINGRFVLGAGFYASLNSIPFTMINSQNTILNFNMGGLEFEYLFIKSNLLKVSVSFFSGAGGLNISTIGASTTNLSNENYLVWEPQILNSMKLISWMDLSLGIGYRFITFTDGTSGKNATNLKGLFGAVSFKFIFE
jgi:hypothetical protein